MKKVLGWRSVPFLLLLINAGWILQTQYSHAALIVAILTLSGMAAALAWGSDTTVLVSGVYGALVVGLILPKIPIPVVQIVKGIFAMINLFPFDESAVFALLCLAGYAATVWFSYDIHKKMRVFPAWLIVARAALQTIVLLCYAGRILGDRALYAELIVVIGMTALIYDFKKIRIYNAPCGCWNALGVTMLLLVSTVVFGCDAAVIGRWAKLDGDRFSIFLAAAGGGALLLCKDADDRRRLVNSAGWYPLVWAALLLVMAVWPGLHSQWGLYLLFPLTALLLDELIEYIDPSRWIGKARAIRKWVLIAFLVLLQIRAERMGRFTALMLLALEIAGGAIIWHAGETVATKEREFWHKCSLGIAAVLLSFTLRIGTPALLQENLRIVLAAVVCCLIWCLICWLEKMLTESDTSMYPDEFELLTKAVWLAPAVLLAASVLCIWLGS